MTLKGSAPTCSSMLRRSGLLLVIAFLISAPALAEDAPNPVCAACHTADGNSIIPEYPKISGLDAAYITKEITDFKSYKRSSEIMGPMSNTISDSEISALATYFSKQKRTPGIITDRALAAQGQLIYDEGIDSTAVPACAGCHEKDGSGSRRFPSLAGQNTAYMIIQMKNFRTSIRNNDGRMRAIMKRMTEQEIVAVAEYITGLKD
jgi:cytochrome c553